MLKTTNLGHYETSILESISARSPTEGKLEERPMELKFCNCFLIKIPQITLRNSYVLFQLHRTLRDMVLFIKFGTSLIFDKRGFFTFQGIQEKCFFFGQGLNFNTGLL